MNLEALYLGLPIAAQNALCSLYGYRLIKRRYSKEYGELERDILAREYCSDTGLREFSCKRLQATINYAAAHVPYYRRLFAKEGITAEDIREPEHLSVLPILDKSTVQARRSEFYSDQLNRIPHSIIHTSGTTGTGLIFPMSLEAEREQWAIWWRYRARFEIDKTTWYAHFYGKTVIPQSQTKPPFWRVNRPGHQILFSAYHMSDSYLAYYVEELNKRQPLWIQGYPSLLAILGGFILEREMKLNYQPKIITVGAESLLPQQKATIEKGFGASCRQHYGMAEGVANISECPEGNLHVDEDYALVEFLPIEGDSCRIIGTSYSNYAFPLIRYDTGDVAQLYGKDLKCSCGRPGRLVRAIDGRIEDYIVTPDGRRIGRADHIFKDMINIKECQIFQDNPHKVVFRVVRGKNYTTDDERRLLIEARKRLGTLIEIDISYLGNLERTTTGKLRFVISDIPQSTLVQKPF
jgi:phenylacetate-CoA ligase